MFNIYSKLSSFFKALFKKEGEPEEDPIKLDKDFIAHDVIRAVIIKLSKEVCKIEGESKKKKVKIVAFSFALVFAGLGVIFLNILLRNFTNNVYFPKLQLTISPKLALTLVNASFLFFIGPVLFIILINCIPLIQKNFFLKRIELLSKDVTQMDFDDNSKFIDSIIKLSYKYLDQYYLLVNIQAKKTFLLTSCIMIVGTLLLFVGILLVYKNSIEVGVLTVVSGVIVELISSIYFAFYSKSIKNLSEYHNKLVFSQNISIALKVVETIDQKDIQIETKQKILEEVIGNINFYLSNNTNKTLESSSKN